jgi:hypothetical protein
MTIGFRNLYKPYLSPSVSNLGGIMEAHNPLDAYNTHIDPLIPSDVLTPTMDMGMPYTNSPVDYSRHTFGGYDTGYGMDNRHGLNGGVQDAVSWIGFANMLFPK